MRPWLIVDCYIEDTGGADNFLPHLPRGAFARVVHAPREPLPLTPAPYAGMIITGSAAGVNDRLPWAGRLVDLTRRAVDAGVPVLGVCFGHQVLAEALCGPGAVRRSPTPELGWFDIEVQHSDPLLAGFPRRFRTFLSHFDEVRPEVLPRLRGLASSARCPVQAFRHPRRPAWGVQFHSEMGPAEASRIIHRRVGQQVPGDPAVVLSRAVDSRPLIRRLVDNFCRQAAHHRA